MFQRSELDGLIYNKPIEYAELILSGGIEEYIKGTPEYRLMEWANMRTGGNLNGLLPALFI